MRLFLARRRRADGVPVLRHKRCQHVERIYLGDVDKTAARAALRRAGTRFELACVPLTEAEEQLLADRCGVNGCG